MPFGTENMQVVDVVPLESGCMVTRGIFEAGLPVATMSREQPQNPADSGWMFTSGQESQAELDDPEGWVIVALNTLANHDSSVVQHLTMPPGSWITRSPDDGRLQVIEGPKVPPSMRFLPAKEAGPVQVSDTLSIEIDRRMFARIEDGALVLWADGLTLFCNVWRAPGDGPRAEIERIRAEASLRRTDEALGRRHGCDTLTYRLIEAGQEVLHCFAANEVEIVQLAIHFDDPRGGAAAEGIWGGLRPSVGGPAPDLSASVRAPRPQPSQEAQFDRIKTLSGRASSRVSREGASADMMFGGLALSIGLVVTLTVGWAVAVGGMKLKALFIVGAATAGGMRWGFTSLQRGLANR